MSDKLTEKKMSRRTFIKGAGILSAMALAAPFFTGPLRQLQHGVWADHDHGTGTESEDYSAQDVLYTTCEQCNTHCTIKTVISNHKERGGYTSIVRKIAGNPYSPLNTVPFGHIDYEASIAKAALGGGSVAVFGRGLRGGRTCLKGQAGIQTAYDAYRIRTPLKRVGPRGSEQWQSISWEQAYDEIINGSKDLGTPGLKAIWAYVPEEEVMKDWRKVKAGTMSQEAFDKKYKDVLIDTKHPDFGPKANQIACLGGNRRDFMRTRIWEQGIGSVNFDDHGGICGVSSVIGNQNSFEVNQKRRTYADLDHCEYMLVFGTNPLVANKGPTWLTPKITNAIQRGMKMAVIDSRLSKSAEKADEWVPVKPGTDGALALAIARWIIENKRYDERYLTNPNLDAAQADGEPTWSDATHLVHVGDERRQKVRAADLDLGSAEQYVVIENGKPVPHDRAAAGELEVDTTVNGMRVKSAFTIYKEEVMKRSLSEYAAITGISVEQISALAKNFTSHGKKAVAWSYRGSAMHTNGYYNTRAINLLNHLLGNYDWKGGSLSAGAKYNLFEGRYDLLTVPGGHKPWGIPITRKGSNYEDSTLFERDGGYPALRPWFPTTGNSSHELIPSAGAAYPYPLKALFVYRMNPILSMPAGYKNIDTLKNPNKIPLLVALDVSISEGAKYADYILPDLTYLERWGQETIYPNQPLKLSSVMQPVTRVVPQARAVEDVFIDLLKEMKLPGVGEKAFTDGSSLNRAEDFYLKMVANIAYDETPVTDANDEEITLFEEARKKALGSFFDIERWKQAVKPEEWRKVVTVLNRGGRFEAANKGYKGDYIKYQFAGQANFYDEKVAAAKHSFTGEYFSGVPLYERIKTYDGDTYESDLPLIMINWKARHVGTHRNISSAWLREIRSLNPVWMNPIDAKRRGLKNGDRIVIQSDSYEAEGEVAVTEGIRPGVVGCSYNFGHIAYGSKPLQIDGDWTGAAKRYGHTPFKFSKPFQETRLYADGRATGFSANNLLSIDKSLENNAMFDPIGGAAAQLFTYVEVKKA